MRSSSPSRWKRNELIYGETVLESEDEDALLAVDDEGDPILRERLNERLDKEIKEDKSKPIDERTYRYESAYVHAMKNMISQVKEKELHLFTQEEKCTLSSILDASYDEQFILSRLVLRKPGWHPISSFEKWKEELGEKEFDTAVQSLCVPFEDEDEQTTEDSPFQPKPSDPEVVDLTVESDNQSAKPTQQQPIASSSPVSPQDTPLDRYNLKIDYFLEDSTNISLEDAINCLNGDSLKKLCKNFRVNPAKYTNPLMVEALLNQSKKQTILAEDELATTPKKGSKKKKHDDGMRQTTLQFAVRSKKTGQEVPRETVKDRMKELVMQELGKCVRVNPSYRHLIHRLHIVCFRSTEHPTGLLLPSLLTHFNKRNYPGYRFQRHGEIWRSRIDLIEYEEVLELQSQLELIMSPPKVNEKEKTPNFRTTALPTSRVNDAQAGEAAATGGDGKEDAPIEDTPKAEMKVGERIAYEVKRFCESERIFERWKDILARPVAKAESGQAGLHRFEAGSIYTRLLCKFVHYLGVLKEYQYQLRLLDALLTQRRWRRGKRANWHERRALIKEKYLSKIPLSELSNSSKSKKRAQLDLHVIGEARDNVVEALLDPDVGTVLRPSLTRRLERLEKTLQLSDEKRTKITGGDELRKPDEVSFTATRIYNVSKEDKLKLDATGRPVDENGDVIMVVKHPGLAGGGGHKMTDTHIQEYFASAGEGEPVQGTGGQQETDQPKREKAKPKWTGKSLWQGKDGEPVTVEYCALQWYAEKGFKGLHSETRILTTIFSLVFWDIIFDSTIPGAFETPYQVAPLDLAEDCFYLARKSAIDERLKEISEDVRVAVELCAENDRMYRENNTWCVGVKWDICSSKDLLEIIECIGGRSLALICRLFCEDYGGRCGGVPDLLVWNYEKKICKLVEVKGPGDKASESQKLWLDTLFRASTAAEICHVVDVNDDSKTRKEKKTPKKKTTSKDSTKGKGKEENIVELEDEDDRAEDDQEVEEVSATETPSARKRKRRSAAAVSDDEEDVPLAKLAGSKVQELAQVGSSAACPLDVDAMDIDEAGVSQPVTERKIGKKKNRDSNGSLSKKRKVEVNES